MREILFRGKRVDNGEWVHGDYCNCRKLDKTVQIRFWKDSSYYACYDVIPETVGQYTGLKDKNGVKIFEGDILDCGDRVVRVTWHKNCGTWDSEFIKYKGQRNSSGIEAKDWCFRAEVIGNIHDNPELLGRQYESR